MLSFIHIEKEVGFRLDYSVFRVYIMGNTKKLANLNRPKFFDAPANLDLSEFSYIRLTKACFFYEYFSVYGTYFELKGCNVSNCPSHCILHDNVIKALLELL